MHVHTHTHTHTHTHKLYHIRSEMHLLSFLNFNIAEIAVCLAILDLMKYDMDTHIYMCVYIYTYIYIYIWIYIYIHIHIYMDIHIYIHIHIYGSLSPHSLCYKKNLIMFYLFFCIFLYLLICGNPSLLSMYYSIFYSTSDRPSFFSTSFCLFLILQQKCCNKHYYLYILCTGALISWDRFQGVIFLV